MGALAVLAMAENAPPTDPAPRRPLHPFFTSNRPPVPTPDNSVVKEAQAGSDNVALPPDIIIGDESAEGAAKQPASRPGRRRKADEEPANKETQKKTRPRKRTRHSTEGGIADHFVKLGKENASAAENTNEISAGSDASGLPQDEPSPTAGPEETVQGDHSALSNGAKANASPNGQPTHHDQPSEPATESPATGPGLTKPRKLLQLNPKTGTIGPPLESKESATDRGDNGLSEKKTGSRRGRKPTKQILRISYGNDPKSRIRIGELINSILNNQATAPEPEQSAPSNTGKQPSKGPKSAARKPAKSTHPFFLGQSKKSDPTPQEPNPKKPNSSPLTARTRHYTSTPISPRKPRLGPAAKISMPQFGVKNMGLKFPGAKLPAWPWEGITHVRGGLKAPDTDNTPLPLPSRKSKGNMVKLSLSESILESITQSMEIQEMATAVRNITTDAFTPPPSELRLPNKHFESGSKLQARVLPELRTFQPSSKPKKEGSSEGPVEAGIRIPPQLIRLFRSIASSLSAFDMSQCETANWVQKYAPTSATEVLQPGKEVFLLRDWLQALMVQSVDTGLAEAEKPKSGAKMKAVGPGKKKRRKKLDGFIVSSDDEDYELQELSEEDDNWAPSGSRGIFRKTVVSRGKDSDKTANALVISGPHGCGKTAAVYAVAKELGFEVFEINPSSRRSGKDVLEKIGDMTRNHHVRQHQSASKPHSQDSEDEVANDVKSGKQSTMGSFFKPKSTATKPKRAEMPSVQNPQSEGTKKEPSKTQRQSLILLEEVDILYEEDKQFWATIVGLIAQSKRPFIMTCNDETVVPLHTLKLHGIFRLDTPPRDLAVDRLILIAANEGHALTRQSVEQLYESRSHDLRAATMDLQYWCQIGVGDRRGGFDWFYLRWPKGIDLDENKEVVRVVSQGTFQSGMNLLGRDNLVDPKLTPRAVEEEILHQVWESWGFDLGHWQESLGLTPLSEEIASTITTPSVRLDVMKAYDDLADAMSVADICSRGSFAAFMEEAMDTTQPEPTAKARDDLVLGRPPLDDCFVAQHDSLSISITSTIKSLARSFLQSRTEKHLGHAAPALDPLDEARAIRCLQINFTSTLPGTASINRMHFAFAFDPIAVADPTSPQPASYLDPSVFDRTLKLITLDVAPYVRSIVAYDSRLQKRRLKLSSLVSEGGKGARGSKRMRTTRAALSALEGGSRSTTRGERWFKADINPYLVAKTAGDGWKSFDSGTAEALENTETSPKSSPTVSPDATPPQTPKKVAQKGKKRHNILEDDDLDELA